MCQPNNRVVWECYTAPFWLWSNINEKLEVASSVDMHKVIAMKHAVLLTQEYALGPMGSLKWSHEIPYPCYSELNHTSRLNVLTSRDPLIELWCQGGVTPIASVLRSVTVVIAGQGRFQPWPLTYSKKFSWPLTLFCLFLYTTLFAKHWPFPKKIDHCPLLFNCLVCWPVIWPWLTCHLTGGRRSEWHPPWDACYVATRC